MQYCDLNQQNNSCKMILPAFTDYGIISWILLLILLVLGHNIWKREPWKKLPPGPFSVPLLGSLPFMTGDLLEVLNKFAGCYGEVYTIYLGSQRTVILNGYATIKEALVKNGAALAGRPTHDFRAELRQGLGVIFSNGNLWKEQRRYVLHVLRDLGLGKKVLENHITVEIDQLNGVLEKHIGVPFNPCMLIQKAVTNVITTFALGRRFEYDDIYFQHYMNIISHSASIVGSNNPAMALPFLRKLPGDFFHTKYLTRAQDEMHKLYQSWIDERKSQIEMGEYQEDLIGMYLLEMKKRNEPNSTFNECQLLRIIADIFVAGSETTSTTLTWSLLYMACYPSIQKQVQKEIDDIIGVDGTVSMDHRTKLPYTEAVMSEIQRLGDIAPLAVPHTTLDDVTIKGFTIPKGTTVLVNLHSVHYDPVLWPEPEKFDPQRFLDANGKYVKREELIQFSLGKRICLGESLARMELFLFFTSLMQRFHFSLPEGKPVPDMEAVLGLTRHPKDFDVIIIARQKNDCV